MGKIPLSSSNEQIPHSTPGHEALNDVIFEFPEQNNLWQFPAFSLQNRNRIDDHIIITCLQTRTELAPGLFPYLDFCHVTFSTFLEAFCSASQHYITFTYIFFML